MEYTLNDTEEIEAVLQSSVIGGGGGGGGGTKVMNR